MNTLASFEDVAALPGRALADTDRPGVEALLVKLSSRFRRLAGRAWASETLTRRLKVDGGVVFLPSGVTDVVAVVDDHGHAVTHVRRGSQLEVAGLASHEFATVTFDTDGTVPDEVRVAIAEAVRRVVDADVEAAKGVTQVTDSAGPFSRTRQFAAWAVGGQALLSPDDVALARSFRRRTPRVWVPKVGAR